MNTRKKDKLVFIGFVIATTCILLWGYATGDMQKIFRQWSPEEREAAQQRALDRLFGSDQTFDASADNVTATAEGTGDSTSCKTLANAKLHIEKGATYPSRVDFAPDVQKLDGKDVTITGYMFPLEASGSQAHFLLSAYPPSCPYCLPGGPTELIEITDSNAITFTYQPITIHGTFHLLHDDALKEGMFYRMSHITLHHA